ncbi:hypothetical protein GCM10027341_32150 [Spirosoma knui]
MLELVVARYQEDLSWLRKRPDRLRVTVYDKGADGLAGANAIPLPNIGREAHTYLHHIVSRYDDLAEWTVFCQGKPFDHAYDFKKTLQRLAEAPERASLFRWLGHLIDTDDDQGERLFRPWSKNEDGRGLDLRGFHRALFGTDGPELYTFVLGAQFVVHRDVVRQRPLAFYERALDVAVTFPDAAHCFERCWDRVLNVTGIDREWLAGRQTVFLKPMRHQTPASEESSQHLEP